MLHIKTGFVCSESKSGQRVTKNSLFKFIGDIPASQMSSAFEDLGESGCILTFFGSCIHSLVHSFMHLISHPFIHPSICSSAHAFSYPFICSVFMHSFNQLCLCQHKSSPRVGCLQRDQYSCCIVTPAAAYLPCNY